MCFLIAVELLWFIPYWLQILLPTGQQTCGSPSCAQSSQDSQSVKIFHGSGGKPRSLCCSRLSSAGDSLGGAPMSPACLSKAQGKWWKFKLVHESREVRTLITILTQVMTCIHLIFYSNSGLLH